MIRYKNMILAYNEWLNGIPQNNNFDTSLVPYGSTEGIPEVASFPKCLELTLKLKNNDPKNLEVLALFYTRMLMPRVVAMDSKFY
jgi:hypothetical protein